MSSASPMAYPLSVRRLRHPAEIPVFVLMVALGLFTHDGRPEPAQPSPEPVTPAG